MGFELPFHLFICMLGYWLESRSLPPPPSPQMSQLFYMDYSHGKIFQSSDVYNDKRLPNVLTVHSFKEPDMMFRIHQFFLELEVNSSEARTAQLKSDLASVAKLTGRVKAFS